MLKETKSNSFLNNILIALTFSIACFIALEIFCRYFLPEVRDTFIVQLRDMDMNERYHHKPSFRSSAFAAPDFSAYRIMFIGDSFTYGHGSDNDPFAARVQEYFLSGTVKGVSKLKVQTFNYGFPSYSPSIYGIILRDYVPKIKPHMVVLAVDDSDVQDDYLYSKMLIKDQNGLPLSVYPELPGVPRYLTIARKLKVVRLTLWMINSMVSKNSEKDFFAIKENRLAHYQPEMEEKWRPNFERSIELLDAMVRYCRQNNIQVVIINYPYAPAVTTEYCKEWRKRFRIGSEKLYEPVFHKYQKQYAELNQIPYYYFTHYLRRLQDLNNIYYEEDGHFTPLGHKYFAREIVTFLGPIISEEIKN